jgi:putative phosphoesterase
MRLAVISDIHGNEVALNAVLREIETAGADLVACLGDVATLGPQPAEVVAMLRSLGCSCVMGNHDAFLLDPELIRSYITEAVILESVDWCRHLLSNADLDLIRSFRPDLEIAVGDGTTMLLTHGTPRSFMEDLLSTTPLDEVDRMLGGCGAAIVACGHTHIQMLRQHRGRWIVNPGSVGMPFEAYASGRPPRVLAHAEYAIVEVREGGRATVSLHRVELDRGALRAAVLATDLPLRAALAGAYA